MRRTLDEVRARDGLYPLNPDAGGRDAARDDRRYLLSIIVPLAEALRELVDGVTGDQTIEECCGYQLRVARELLTALQREVKP
jgi:hypothetical protein